MEAKGAVCIRFAAKIAAKRLRIVGFLMLFDGFGLFLKPTTLKKGDEGRRGAWTPAGDESGDPLEAWRARFSATECDFEPGS